MRSLLIALVLGLAALTAYSALWFKSESIEDDITQRVTEDLAASGAENIGIDVDGRHVTLSGVVFDEATEEAYLATADDTYGALGPIDGLTMQADGGYLTAIKTMDGITLRGTVPNEDVRATLLAEADAATDGTVDDQLIVSGPEADWQSEATFGIGQLAGLTTGTLTAASGAYVLSGNTDVDPEVAAAAVGDRAGWTTLLSSTAEEESQLAELARLNGELDGEIADQSAQIGELETNVTDLRGEIVTLTGERDTIATELADLRAGLTEGEANSADLRAQLDAAGATIGERDQTIATLEADLGDANGSVDALTGQVAERDATIEALTRDAGDLSETVGNLTADVADREATIEVLNNQVAGLSSNADQSVADLTGELAARDGTIAELTAAVSDRDQRIAELTGTVADLDGSVAGTAARIAELSTAVEARDGRVLALEGEVTDLTARVAARDETIAALQNRPAASGNSAEQCAAQATNVLAGSRINFETGSAQISGDSVELLERLTGIALACVSDDLSVEIGGHTDARGATDANQTLSEARAQAVLAFMTVRGVPADGLQATGFGESQPIASNDTPEGRAQNRRISFDWQAR